MKICRLYFLLLVLCTAFGCTPNKHPERYYHDPEELRLWRDTCVTADARRIRSHLLSYAGRPSSMYADAYTRKYYKQHGTLLWIDGLGTDWRADSLLHYLKKTIPSLGLSPHVFPIADIQQGLDQLHNLNFRTRSDYNRVLGSLEYNLTQAYLRYVCGCRFGFVQPSQLFNRLEAESDKRSDRFRHLYEFETEHVTDSFIHLSLAHIRKGTFLSFFQEIQPNHPLYNRLQNELLSPDSNTRHRRLAGINMERCRWRHPRPSGKYVWVNMADYRLYAVDEKADTFFHMKVCVGDTRHKTPLLNSRIQRVEFNPYWIVPYSILSKEIAPKLHSDPDYFIRNHMKIIERSSGKTVDPDEVTVTQLKSGNYYLRQEKGAGNSLGRMIFRFPNNHAVYLHDTNSPSAFRRAHRAISHGCVRVERPLDLALFLMSGPTEDIADSIRVTIDLPARTTKGKTWQNDSTFKKLKTCSYDPAIPVYLDYLTLYYAPDGTRITGNDPYGYDKLMENLLHAF